MSPLQFQSHHRCITRTAEAAAEASTETIRSWSVEEIMAMGVASSTTTEERRLQQQQTTPPPR
jgi:hypothetical protein